MGLALENFNGEGRHQQPENGVLLDASGNLDGVEFENVVGLAAALRENPALPSCLVQRVYSYGSGGPVGAEENLLLAHFNEYFAAEGYRFPDLLRKIALSDSFSKIVADWSPAPFEDEPNGDDQPGNTEQEILTMTRNTAHETQ